MGPGELLVGGVRSLSNGFLGVLEANPAQAFSISYHLAR